jgi:hypothetical protein
MSTDHTSRSRQELTGSLVVHRGILITDLLITDY